MSRRWHPPGFHALQGRVSSQIGGAFGPSALQDKTALHHLPPAFRGDHLPVLNRLVGFLESQDAGLNEAANASILVLLDAEENPHEMGSENGQREDRTKDSGVRKFLASSVDPVKTLRARARPCCKDLVVCVRYNECRVPFNRKFGSSCSECPFTHACAVLRWRFCSASRTPRPRKKPKCGSASRH